MQTAFRILKAEARKDHTLVVGPVLVPEVPDNQGDVAGAEVIEAGAHDYLAKSRTPGLMHRYMLGGQSAEIVESYIDRTGKSLPGVTLEPGTWVVAMRVRDEKLRKLIADGTLTGFSIGGRGRGYDVDKATAVRKRFDEIGGLQDDDIEEAFADPSAEADE